MNLMDAASDGSDENIAAPQTEMRAMRKHIFGHNPSNLLF